MKTDLAEFLQYVEVRVRFVGQLGGNGWTATAYWAGAALGTVRAHYLCDACDGAYDMIYKQFCAAQASGGK